MGQNVSNLNFLKIYLFLVRSVSGSVFCADYESELRFEITCLKNLERYILRFFKPTLLFYFFHFSSK